MAVVMPFIGPTIPDFTVVKTAYFALSRLTQSERIKWDIHCDNTTTLGDNKC
jgi:hypothetical protein